MINKIYKQKNLKKKLSYKFNLIFLKLGNLYNLIYCIYLLDLIK